MPEINLIKPLKLVDIDSKAFPLGTKFIYRLPSFVLDFDGLDVICSLKENNVLQYKLDGFFAAFISEPRFNREFILRDLEERLVDFEKYLRVEIVDNDSQAFLIEETNNLPW